MQYLEIPKVLYDEISQISTLYININSINMQFIFATAKLPASKKSKSKRMCCAMLDGNSLFVNIILLVSIKTKFLSHLENYIC